MYNERMAVHRRVIRVGGSVAILIPSAIAEMMGVSEGSPVTMMLTEGRQLVIDPDVQRVEETSGHGERPNAETRAAMRELERGGLPRFKTVDAFMADLHADD